MLKYFKKRGFTDRLYMINFLLTHLIVIACIVVMVNAYALNIADLTPCTVIITAAYAELGVYTGFVVAKAKSENRRKHAMSLIRDIADQYGIEPVIQIADIVLRD